jgi:hypothetical protein
MLPVVGVLAAVYFANGLTAAGHVMSNEQFVAIYARLRHPHHLVPSGWDWVEVDGFVCFVLGTVLLVLATAAEALRAQQLRQWILPTVVLPG